MIESYYLIEPCALDPDLNIKKEDALAEAEVLVADKGLKSSAAALGLNGDVIEEVVATCPGCDIIKRLNQTLANMPIKISPDSPNQSRIISAMKRMHLS